MKRRNTHSYDTQSIQQKILPILKSFDQVCREHNLTYYIWAGTQLGAIRHKGFIPWDDDADVAMPRKDYEILMQHAHEWIPAPFSIANRLNAPRYPHYFARIQDTSTTMIIRKHLGYIEGVHVDIFPLDNVPNGKHARAFHFWRLKILHRLLYLSSRSPRKDNKRHKIILYSLLQRVIKPSDILGRISKHIQKHNGKECSNCTDSFYSSKDYVSHSILGQPRPYSFAGIELYGVDNADQYLTEKYGDYMTPPSDSKDHKQHSVDFLDFELPFSQFRMSDIE